ncbi:MAG: Na+/H+ antiporter NhaA [Planctomycetota bacterium]|nr:Na+/H+ antiporter NhaA [Planctomycetota bacterium]
MSGIAPAPEAPPSLLARLLSPFARFLRSSSAGGVLVLVCTVIALLIANSPWHAAFAHWLHTPLGIAVGGRLHELSLAHFINDGLMCLFFLMVGLEIKRELLIGELSEPRKAALPLIAAAGGMLVPAAIYTAFNFQGEGERGWGIPMATDIAFALGVLRLTGRFPPAVFVFLAALAIADDLGAVLVIALFYTGHLSWSALGLAAASFLALLLLGRARVTQPLPYVLLGLVLWAAMLHSGVHATVAGVLLAAAIPLQGPVAPADAVQWAGRTCAQDAPAAETVERLINGLSSARSPLVAWEQALGPWVNFVIVPLFALANAGVVFDRQMLEALGNTIFWGVFCGLLLGKPVGIVGASLLAVRLGWAALPGGLTRAALVAAGVLGGIGFTMALFITALAFGEQGLDQQAIAKAGILAGSLVAGVLGFVLCRRLTPGG